MQELLGSALVLHSLVDPRPVALPACLLRQHPLSGANIRAASRSRVLKASRGGRQVQRSRIAVHVSDLLKSAGQQSNYCECFFVTRLSSHEATAPERDYMAGCASKTIKVDS